MRARTWLVSLALIAASFAGAVPAASPARATDPSALSDDARLALLRQKIKYVFVLYQENRSFDSYFGTFPGADGLYADPPAQLSGFSQPIVNTDGSMGTVMPFRIGPEQYAADTDDVDHSHGGIVAKMDIVDGVPQMDRFAMVEEREHAPASGDPTIAAKQFGELTMAHEDCDTVPFLWLYAKRFALYDHFFQAMAGPSTPGNLTIIAGQTGITQWLLHPDEASAGNGDEGRGVPVEGDDDPFWGSPSDKSANPMPVNPRDFPRDEAQINLTFASLPLTLAGRSIGAVASHDQDPVRDLVDVEDDIAFLTKGGVESAVPWGWYEEGYDREPTDDGATDALGRHASYITHHNGPQYFGYIANNGDMRAHLHGLDDFITAVTDRTLPAEGVFYVKGGSQNIMQMLSADPDPAVRAHFLGDDDHPQYSDAQISEAMLARVIDSIANSPYWDESAIIITWDDSEGDYDHVPPPLRTVIPGKAWVSDGPRIPLILISPYARSGAIAHEFGDQVSVIKLVDELFGLTPLALLPDESRASELGLERFGVAGLGPLDAPDNGVGDLVSGFDDGRLAGTVPPLPPSMAEIPDALINVLPQTTGYGCSAIGITPTDVRMGISNPIPPDFNPRPKTDPTH